MGLKNWKKTITIIFFLVPHITVKLSGLLGYPGPLSAQCTNYVQCKLNYPQEIAG